MADTIREFLVGLGWQLDESGERRFIAAIEGATLRANLLADAIENMARVVVDKVAVVAENFEQLHYAALRIGASENSVTAFEDAVKRLGGTAESARASLIGFGDFLRTHPNAASSIAKQLGIPLKETADHGKFLLEIGEKLNHMAPALADRFRQTFQFGDYNTITGAGREGGRQFYEDSLKRQREAGLTPEAYKAAAEFENKWRDVWDRIGTMADGGYTKLLGALTDPMQKFGKWLDENSPKINEAITNMATAVGSLTIAWVDDLNKVHWADVAKDFDGIAKSIAHFTDELVRSLPLLQAFLGALLGAKVGGLFGPLGALLGAGAGALAPGMIEQEMDPNAPHAVDTGVGGMLGRAWGGVKRFFGGGGGSGAGSAVTPPGPPGTYRPGYNLSEKDLSDEVVKTINGEASTGNPAAIDAVINNMFNRLGAHGYGPSGNLEEVARSQGENGRQPQYTGYTPASATQAKLIRDRIRAIASGGIQDNTHGSMEYRGAWLYDAFRLRHPEGVGVGGNWFFPTNAQAGPYAAFPTPHETRPSRPITPTPTQLHFGGGLSWDQGPAWNNLNASLPVGGSINNDNSKAITSSVTNNVTVNAPDPHSAAAMVGLHLDRSANDLARNLQGAHQ